MASNLKAQFEAEAARNKPAPAKPEPTGVAALRKKHKDFIDPPPPKVSWQNDHQGRTGGVEASHIKYTREGGKPRGPPPKKDLTDLP